jgi:hypothetical protein
MLKFWIHKDYIPEEDLRFFVQDKNECVEIFIDETCKKCNKKRILYISNVRPDGPNNSSSFEMACEHAHTYQDVYKNRIKDIAKTNDHLNDGAKCSGRCGSWVPMAAPNQLNGTFICFGCRNSW